ncbi:MAG: sugar ABC transporter permease [Anaerolineae bacterium]|nr:sugar ABC transporter permease [Anaerolineae bacterium]MDW8100636.1 sugar ABC transporter permease [Anaerolineae bacterium]
MEAPAVQMARVTPKAVVAQRRARLWRKTILPWLFIAPILILNVIVILGPSIGSAFFAFTEWSGLGTPKWVGLANFQRMLTDRVYRIAFTNNVKWTLIFLTVPIAMGLLGSALLAPIKRFAMFYRVAYFLPYVIASVVNAQIWRNILHPTMGIGPFLAERGLEFMNISFFGNRHVVLYSIAFVDNWHWWGFLVVLYLAAMQAVDPELYEAARLEGANRWQEWRHVTLPGILPTLVFTILMTIIWSFLVFDYIYLLTQGGPAHASEVLATEVFKSAFFRFEVGYAAAIGLSMSFIAAMVVTGFIILRRRGWQI